MAHYRIGKLFLLVLVGVICQAAVSWAEFDYIDISNPFLRKIPMAVPVFITVTGSEAGSDLPVMGADLLAQTLDFTGYFKMIDRSAFLVDEGGMDIIAAGINFLNWTGIGAEMLITGGILARGEVLETELRLYDTFKQKLLVGKRYKGRKSDLRKVVRLFCGEVIYHLTGDRGMFNSKIAYVQKRDGNKEIFVCEFDGHAPEQLTRNQSITLFPAWSPDGRWMAYTSYVNGKPDIYIRHLTEDRGHIIAKKGINSAPAWLPGQFALAATLSFSGDPEIYLLTGSGKFIRKLTHTLGIDDGASFSPDGKHMAFVSNRSGTPQIYIKDLDSDQDRRLTFEGRYNQQPSWSPQGGRIAYTGMDDGQMNIYTIGTDGEGLMQLTRNSGDNESPTWSPDGSLLAFSSTRRGDPRIYVMTAYGTDQRELSLPPGDHTEPEWSPNIDP